MTLRPDGPEDGPPTPRPVPPPEPVQRWRLTLRRAAVDPGEAQKAWQHALVEGLVASGLPLAGMDAVPPRPRVAIGAPLPAGMPGERELVDVMLVSREPAWRVREVAAAAIPAGDTLVDCIDVWTGVPPLPGLVTAAVYRIVVVAPGERPGIGDLLLVGRLRAAASEMLDASSLPRMRRKGEQLVPYELRPFLEGISVDAIPGAAGVAVRATLRHDPEKGIGRPEEVVGELADRAGAALEARAVVRERLVLADELPHRAPPKPPTPVRSQLPPGRRPRR